MAVDLPVDLTIGMISATVEIDQPQEGGPRIVGTGFLVNAPNADGSPRTVLVTAAHVLDNMPGQAARIGYRFKEPVTGIWKFSAQALPIRDGALQLWVKNPTKDVAAMVIQAPPEFARAAIPLAWLAEEKDLQDTAVGPGDEMMVLGYPEGLAANHQGFPILRSGRVASYPVTPISEFPSFLLDFRVFSGNSGGPVFMTSDLRRRPGAGDAKGQFVAGVLTQQTSVGGERLELGIVAHAVFVRQTIGLLDRAVSVGDAAPRPAVSGAAPGPP